MELADFLVNLSVILTGLAVYFHFKAFSFWSSRGVPGPTPWPIFGTEIYYVFYNKIQLDEYWKNKYGRTFGLYEGYAPQLRTTDVECIKQIFVKQFNKFADRNNRWITQENPRRWLLFSFSELWANQRALISPMFSASKMRQMYNVMSDCVDRLVEDVNRRASDQETKSTTTTTTAAFDKFAMSSATLDVIASSFFGLKLDTYKVRDEPDKFVENAYKFGDFSVARFFTWLVIPRQLARILKYDLLAPEKYQYFADLSQSIIKQRRNNKTIKRDDVIQALIDAKLPEKHEQVFTELDDKEAHYADLKHEELEEMQKQQAQQAKYFRSFDDLEIKGQMTFFFIAGFETTASTLAFALFVMSHEPLMQEKVLAELRDVFGARGEKMASNDAVQNYGDLLNLKYMEAFISELLRMYTPVVERHRMVTSPEGTTLEYQNKNGQLRRIHLPKTVAISTNAHLVHRDPEYFDRPDEFDVSRFYPENKNKIKSGTYMPFGLGPRYCVGMRFALLEVKLALAKLLLNFRVLPSESSQYPPKFLQNAVFLQFGDTSFRLSPHKA